MSQVTKKGPVKPQMNITPLIDVVFLLIIFFMLVNKIVSEENVAIVVPRIDDSRAIDLGEIERVVISVAFRDFDMDERISGDDSVRLRSPGQDIFVQVGQREYSFEELNQKNGDPEQGAAAMLKRRVEASKDAAGKPTLEVLLRADAAMAYADVQQVMTMITAAGVGKVNLVTFMPDE